MPASKQTRVKVFLRSRPCENFASEMIDFGADGKVVNIYNRKQSANQGFINNQITDWSFKVDEVLHNVSQETVYNKVVRDITLKALEGYNGTVLCYGQTGAGKTFTMTGATENYNQRGMIPRTIQHLFKEIHSRQDVSYTIRIGYTEIYNEQFYDLLSPSPATAAATWTNANDTTSAVSSSNLSVCDDRGDVFVKGLTYQLATNEEDALNLLFEGETNRSIGAHILNKESSRSHCIFTIRIESKSISASDEKYTISKLNLVDLAGSERLAKTQSQGITQKEAQYINKSLSFLEQAVIGLSEKRSYVQFRQCKLTHALKDSIGGNCMTCMIANIWPEARHMEETVSTLRFASRMMNVAVEPAVNEVIDPMRMMQKLDGEVRMLRQELAMHDTFANRKNQSYEPLSEHQLLDVENQCRRFLDKNEEIEINNLRQVKATFSAFKRIYKLMEKDVEARLREKYALIDKNDVEQLAEAQKAGLTLTDDTMLMGETDGQNFGVGQAGRDARVNKNELLKITKKNRGKAGAKTSSPPLDSKSSVKTGPSNKDLSTADSKKDLLQQQQNFQHITPPHPNSNQAAQRPSTPPAKQVAFEEFKQERGSEINRIWNENKEILGAKRRQYSELAHRINETKAQIDHTRGEVERKRSERMAMGEFVSELGDPIIDEEEFGLIKHLQTLKGTYREDFDKWRELKAEIVYCQNLVEQCRQRLLQEFDVWYNETYMNGAANSLQQPSQNQFSTRMLAPHSSSGFLDTYPQSANQYEDIVEKFERMQRQAMSANEPPESVAFNAARMRNDRKHVFSDAMERSANHHYLSHNTTGNSNNNRIGTPHRRVANPPPNKLSVY